jgi:mono/diheme cytochrome c family protein
VAVATLVLAIGCGDDGDSNADAGPDPLVERGAYLANNVAQCPFCHTPRREDGTPDFSLAFSGVDCLTDVDPEDPDVGCLPTRNLTNHETGLMNATDQEIKDAFMNGVGTDGRVLHPVMPYWLFNNFTDDDADAIVAYLRTLAGIDNMVGAPQPPFANFPAAKETITLGMLPDPSASFTGDTEAATRGKYLVTVSLCVDCHTPEMTPGMLDFDLNFALAGNRVLPTVELLGYPVPPFPETIYSANLTPDATGLEGWTKEDIVRVMKDGILTNDEGVDEGVCAPTHAGQSSPYAGLTDGDLDDIATYLLSLDPVANARTEDCTAAPVPPM